MKLTKRKGFNFFRSYYDVYNELPIKDKLIFIDALLDRQFLGIKPKDLKGMSKFAYISQTNSIDSQVKGYEDKTKTRLDGRLYIKGENTPTAPPTDGVELPPTLQEKEKEKEQDVIPTEREFMLYLKDERLKDDPERYQLIRRPLMDKYQAWVAGGWIDGKGNKIKNWKSKACHQLTYIK
jgi:hypothetical protein